MRGLNGITAKHVLQRLWAEILADDVFGRSAQLAYYFFLALFPFLIFVVASLSVFGVADRGRGMLFAFFGRLFPPQAVNLISTTFTGIIKSSGPLKMSLGIVVSLWSSSLGMSAVMDTLNAAYKVRETRSLLKQYATAVALTLIFAGLVIVSIMIVIAGDYVITALPLGKIAHTTWLIVEWPFSLIAILVAFAVLYYFAPNLAWRRWQWITPGAVAGIIFMGVVSVGLRFYVRYSNTYTLTYGSLGAVIVLLLCFYVGGLAVLFGGVLNAVLDSLKSGEPVRYTPPKADAA